MTRNEIKFSKFQFDSATNSIFMGKNHNNSGAKTEKLKISTELVCIYLVIGHMKVIIVGVVVVSNDPIDLIVVSIFN